MGGRTKLRPGPSERNTHGLTWRTLARGGTARYDPVMPTLPSVLLAFSTVALMVGAAASLAAPRQDAGAIRCSIRPGRTLALLHIERDTMLPLVGIRDGTNAYAGGPMNGRDSLLAVPGTPMPAARVRLLQVDSATHATLAAAGVAGDEPAAFIRAAPFREDCRVVRWTDTTRFVTTGEEGYVRANLAPRDQWIDGTPVFVVSQVWYYPYPHRGRISAIAAAPMSSARAMFSANLALEAPSARSREQRVAADSAKRARAIAWIAANTTEAEREPVRSMLRRAVLDPDWAAASSAPSRLRGTWQVDIEADGERHTWFFRTHVRPGYPWAGPRPEYGAAAAAAAPWTPGYLLVGYPADSRDSLATPPVRARRALVWLAIDDRPTAPGNDARRTLSGVLEFTLAGAPEALWATLDPFVPPLSSADSAFRAQTGRPQPRDQRQPELPITVHLDGRGGARADTTLSARGHRIRVTLVRLDTVSVERPY